MKNQNDMIKEVQALLEKGQIETNEMPHEETLYVMRMLDTLRREWEVYFPADDF